MPRPYEGEIREQPTVMGKPYCITLSREEYGGPKNHRWMQATPGHRPRNGPPPGPVQPLARISTCGMTKTASGAAAQRPKAAAIASSSPVSLKPYETACSPKRE
jgi:hypothetical protein